MTKYNLNPPTLFKLQGNKRRLLPFLIPVIERARDGRRLVLPFAGTWTEVLAIEPERAYLADANVWTQTSLMRIANGTITPESIFKYAEILSEQVNEDPSRYYEIRDVFNTPTGYYPFEQFNIEKVRAFIWLGRACFNGLIRFNNDKQFNVAIGDRIMAVPGLIREATKFLVETWNRHEDWEAVAGPTLGDFGVTLELARKDDFLYLDPPYGNYTRYYNVWDTNEDARLIGALRGTKAEWVLSCIKSSPLYTMALQAFPKCAVIEKEHQYIIGGTNGRKKKNTEVLIMSKR